MELKQTGLIDRIVEALGLDQKMATPKWTPAEAKPLTKDCELLRKIRVQSKVVSREGTQDDWTVSQGY